MSYHDQSRQFWDRIGEEDLRPEKDPSPFFERFISEHPLKAGDTVLDQGTGTGIYAARAARTPGVKVIATDISDEMLERARHRFEAQRLNAEFKQGMSSEIDLPSGSVDLVISMGVIHHNMWGDIRKSFAEAARVLKTGCHLVLQVRSINDTSTKREQVSDEGYTAVDMSGNKKGVVQHYFTKEELLQLASENDFEIINEPEEKVSGDLESQSARWQVVFKKKPVSEPVQELGASVIRERRAPERETFPIITPKQYEELLNTKTLSNDFIDFQGFVDCGEGENNPFVSIFRNRGDFSELGPMQDFSLGLRGLDIPVVEGLPSCKTYVLEVNQNEPEEEVVEKGFKKTVRKLNHGDQAGFKGGTELYYPNYDAALDSDSAAARSSQGGYPDYFRFNPWVVYFNNEYNLPQDLEGIRRVASREDFIARELLCKFTRLVWQEALKRKPHSPFEFVEIVAEFIEKYATEFYTKTHITYISYGRSGEKASHGEFEQKKITFDDDPRFINSGLSRPKWDL